MEFSIIVLTRNKRSWTERCLPTLLESRSRDWELIVVDNGSEDGTVEWLQDFQSRAAAQGVSVRVVANPANFGCSTARNQGASLASGRRLVFLDNDVSVRTSSWLERLNAVFDAVPGAAIVGPKLVYPFPPYRIQFAGGGITRRGRVVFLGRGADRLDPRFQQRREVPHVISACLMIRTECFQAAGGFDEAFNPVQFEDTDLCYRVRRLGGRIVYEPSAEMYHYESVTTAGSPDLVNTALVVRHGLLFRRRWAEAISREPEWQPEEEAAWTPIPTPSVEGIPPPPVLPD
jgi:GT2 family glycosyltransferase